MEDVLNNIVKQKDHMNAQIKESDSKISFSYKKEAKFPDLLSPKERQLRLDWFIQASFIKRPICIEFDGANHFASQRFSGNDEEEHRKWIYRVRSDLIKNKYISQKNWHLLRIDFKYPRNKLKFLIDSFIADIIQHERKHTTSYIKLSNSEIYEKQKVDTIEHIVRQESTSKKKNLYSVIY